MTNDAETSLGLKRISDINGMASAFPLLSNMKEMNRLILRNCNLTGRIPEYIWAMAKLGTLDLSYNNCTLGSSGQCQQGSLNLFGNPPAANNIFLELNISFFNTQKNKGIATCRSLILVILFLPMTELSSLHINCGGEKVTINGVRGSTTFSADQDLENWAFSSTGDFFINSRETDNYIASNIFRLSMPDFSLYTRALLSPLSLTYYGLCLLNGNYTVKLHFAEIMFTDDKTYSILGKSMFDVYIQVLCMLQQVFCSPTQITQLICSLACRVCYKCLQGL
ncbi:putative leucine-rich repeat receptor-like serine/threonine-protein kinase isoform X1 [Cinnamomum micranthum f. kanehirae]|uniref:Putative leucine-rich repeat receptor-like serine/threonine-protein kinase isoform X1 n=1 Tax=Cinnamomum micranthum f. kanehirae TaxID=337451 RepID=A0A3S3PRG8_9MAGN|nr:putative leucine-rich repeat receptor-like serine/threonine-protein kinase isoform X1 [Cinnamomum micranthum f. kanehirae]